MESVHEFLFNEIGSRRLVARVFGLLRPALWPINPRGGIPLQRHRILPRTPFQCLLGGAKLGLDALPHITIEPSGEKETGAGRDQNEDLWHRLEPEAGPKRPRFDRRDEIGGKSACRETKTQPIAFGENAAPTAEPRGR